MIGRKVSLIVSNEAMNAIRSAGSSNFETKDSEQQPDGQWIMFLAEDTFERLEEIKSQAETWSDVIIRLVSGYQTQGRKQ